MNRGSINSYTLNAPAKTGGAVRVAADLIGRAFVVAQARIWCRLTGPASASATVNTIVGRRMTRQRAAIVLQAVIEVTPVRWARAVVAASGDASVSLLAKIGRRIATSVQGSATVGYLARVFRKTPQPLDAQADVAPGYRVDKRVQAGLTGQSQAVITAKVFALRLLRQDVFFTGQATGTANAHREMRPAGHVVSGQASIDATPIVIPLQLTRVPVAVQAQAGGTAVGHIGRRDAMSVTAEARIGLFAGVQNDFPYDEDAPPERTFVVAFENNVFYVVS